MGVGVSGKIQRNVILQVVAAVHMPQGILHFFSEMHDVHRDFGRYFIHTLME